MPMETIESKNILIGLYGMYKGNWDNMFKAIKERVVYTPGELKEMVDGVSKPGCKFYTAVSCDFSMTEATSEVIKKMYKPPFCWKITGNTSILDAIGKHRIIGVEDERMATFLLKYGFIVARVIPGTTDGEDVLGPSEQHIRITNGATGEVCCITEDTVNIAPLINRLASICSKFVFSIGDKKHCVSICSGDNPDLEIFALPGNSGSVTNQLIKQGVRLCDCAADLDFGPEGE